MNREKVIKAYEDFVNGYECFCTSDDYEYEMHKAVLALLKEQEAELSFREAKAITHTATKLDDATCPSCGNVVGEKIRIGTVEQSVVQVQWDYCCFCGQKLDWEGR